MVTKVERDITQVWQEFKQDQSNQELRNRLVEMYLPLVKYNGERIWSRLPEGVELDDLISAGVFGLMDAIDAFDLDARRQVRDLLRAAHPRGHARRAAHDGLGAAAGPLARPASSNEARKTLEAQLGRPPTRRRDGRAAAASPSQELEKMIGRRQRRQPRQPQQEVVRDRQLQGRPRDRHPRRQEGRRPDAPHPEARPDAAGHQGPQPQRAADHHPLLLRRADDEGDRRHARPQRIAASARCTRASSPACKDQLASAAPNSRSSSIAEAPRRAGRCRPARGRC